jgi:hypothetical protein
MCRAVPCVHDAWLRAALGSWCPRTSWRRRRTRWCTCADTPTRTPRTRLRRSSTPPVRARRCMPCAVPCVAVCRCAVSRAGLACVRGRQGAVALAAGAAARQSAPSPPHHLHRAHVHAAAVGHQRRVLLLHRVLQGESRVALCRAAGRRTFPRLLVCRPQNAGVQNANMGTCLVGAINVLATGTRVCRRRCRCVLRVVA